MTSDRKLSTTYPIRIAASVTEEQARALRRLVLARKQEDESLPLRWGVSDLVREIVAQYLATTGQAKAREEGKSGESQRKSSSKGGGKSR